MATVEQNTLKTELRKFIIDTFLIGEEKESLNDSDSFMQNGYIDSTGILELTQHIEATYEFTIEDDEMVPENLDSIDNLIKYITSKLGG